MKREEKTKINSGEKGLQRWWILENTTTERRVTTNHTKWKPIHACVIGQKILCKVCDSVATLIIPPHTMH